MWARINIADSIFIESEGISRSYCTAWLLTSSVETDLLQLSVTQQWCQWICLYISQGREWAELIGGDDVWHASFKSTLLSPYWMDAEFSSCCDCGFNQFNSGAHFSWVTHGRFSSTRTHDLISLYSHLVDLQICCEPKHPGILNIGTLVFSGTSPYLYPTMYRPHISFPIFLPVITSLPSMIT